MASNTNNDSASTCEQSLKLAVAISLLRSKFSRTQTRWAAAPPPDSDALRWKRKAKERKQEILRLRDDLKEAEDSSQCDMFPQSASCKCYFFDNLGQLSPKQDTLASNCRFSDVLRRRFLRQVRLKERRRGTGGHPKQRQLLATVALNCEDEAEQLRASVDFLVDLCDTVSAVEKAYFANWSHQAVEFILASLKNLLSTGNNMEVTEGIVNSLIMRLVKRMCSPSHGDQADTQFYIQHLIRQLGIVPYVGQRTLLSVSQRISVVAENLLFLDPFDEGFPDMHGCLFIMIQLVEFLVSDHLLTWLRDECLDNDLLQEWVTAVLQARKALELLESRNGLYAVYMDRVTGELARKVGQVASPLEKFNQDILDKLFN